MLALGNAGSGELLIRLRVEFLARQPAHTLTRGTPRLQHRVCQPVNTQRTGQAPRIVSQQARTGAFKDGGSVDIAPRQQGKLGGETYPANGHGHARSIKGANERAVERQARPGGADAS